MPHRKRAAECQISLPFYSFLTALLRVLLLRRAHVQAHLLGRVLLHKEHGLVVAAL